MALRGVRAHAALPRPVRAAHLAPRLRVAARAPTISLRRALSSRAMPGPTVLHADIPKGWEHFYPKEKKEESKEQPSSGGSSGPERGKGDDKDNDDKDKDKDKEEKKPKAEEKEHKASKHDKDDKASLDDKSDKKDGDGDKKRDDDKDDKDKKDIFKFLENPTAVWGGVAGVTALLTLAEAFQPTALGDVISYEMFVKDFLAPGLVESLQVINKHIVNVLLHNNEPPVHFEIGSLDAFEFRLEDDQLSLGRARDKLIPVSYIPGRDQPLIASAVRTAPYVMMAAWAAVITRLLVRTSSAASGAGGIAGGLLSFGRMKNKKATRPTTTFKDVAGLPEAKQEISEFVSFLKEPQKYASLGAKIPKGALLVGPPGTGKTLLAKAAAGEAKVDFFSVNGADFVELYGGVGAARVRDLFKQARESAPCIVFIDEIDAVGRARGGRRGNDERENTLNQLLVELDGFNPSAGIVVLAGTNRADVLDKALLRSGRFDRQISVDNPDREARHDIFLVHLRPLKLAKKPESYARKLAVLTPGFSGADIANVCNEAALIAARHDRTEVDLPEFEAAIDRVVGGIERKSKVLSPEEKKRVALHESGHAVAGWFLEGADPVLKVSIVPRGVKALGYAQSVPKSNYLGSSEEILDKMAMALGGRASEALFLRSLSSGAADDLQRVTSMAYRQILSFGMNARIGPLAFREARKGELKYQKPFSQHTAELIDTEVRQTISVAYNRVCRLLEEKKTLVDALATHLIDKEVLRHDDLVRILGPRPFRMDPRDDPNVENVGSADEAPPIPTGKPNAA